MRWPVIYGDPNWAYQNWTARKNGAAASVYDCASIEEICSWPVERIAADDALLFLWATFPHLEGALRVMTEWGFAYVCTPFVWVKTTRDGRPAHGPGFWTAAGAEIVLLGRRGRGIRRYQETRGCVRQVVTAPRLGHSAKPHRIAREIEALVGPDVPILELFARGDPPHLREKRWTGTGLEYDGMLLADFIAHHQEVDT